MEAESSQIYKYNLYLEQRGHCIFFQKVKLVFRAMVLCPLLPFFTSNIFAVFSHTHTKLELFFSASAIDDKMSIFVQA